MAYPLHRFRALAALTEEEEQVLLSLGEAECQRQAGDIFQRQGEPAKGFHLLIDGWVASAMIMADGHRLIQKLHLPGDMLGTPSIALSDYAVSLTAITDARTSFVPYQAIGDLFTSWPRLAALFALAIQIERLALMDALAATGNAKSKGNAARFLLDLHDRLTAIGRVEDGTFEFPLTQAMMGELLGITPVHTNRVIRTLERSGLIRRGRRSIQLLDIDELRHLSPIAVRRPRFEPPWLPKPGRAQPA